MEGNIGLNTVNPVLGTMGITFLEVLATGAVQFTAIAKSGGAVHSRNTVMFEGLVSSQYYGICR